MKWITALALALAMGMMVGCKKDETATGGDTATTATAPGDTTGATNAPSTKMEGETSGGGAVTMESVAGVYDSHMNDEALAQLEKAGQKFGGGTMTFNADGTFEGMAKIGDNEVKTKGTFTVDGNKVTTQVSEINGQKAADAPPQEYIVSADGTELAAQGAGMGVTLKKH